MCPRQDLFPLSRVTSTVRLLTVLLGAIAAVASCSDEEEANLPDPMLLDGSSGSDDGGVPDSAIQDGAAAVVIMPDVMPDVAAPLLGVYVDPALGLDANPGTQALPFKTISKAAMAVPSGQNVFLADGLYDNTNQTNFNVNFARPVTLRGMSLTGVRIKSPGPNDVITFNGAGGIENVQLENLGLTVLGSGNFSIRNVQFSAMPGAGIVRFGGTIVANIDARERPFLANMPMFSSLQTVWVDEATQVSFTGDLQGSSVGAGPALFYVRGTARLTISSSMFANFDRRLVTAADNAHVLLKNVNVSNLKWASQNPLGGESGVITTGGQNGAVPLDYSIELEDTTITGCALTGIIVTLYSATNTQAPIKLTRSHIDNNAGYGIRVGANGVPGARLNVTISLNASTLKNNGAHGIFAQATNVVVVGGEISGNMGDGILLDGATYKNSVIVHGAAIAGNKGNGIALLGSATSSMDLGKTGTPGGNTFSQVAVGKSAVALSAAIAGFAVGNTWIPVIQNASAAGLFIGPVSFAANTVGQNVTVGAGASLLVSE
jgi:Protein of unknown function (DUF1565)